MCGGEREGSSNCLSLLLVVPALCDGSARERDAVIIFFILVKAADGQEGDVA